MNALAISRLRGPSAMTRRSLSLLAAGALLAGLCLMSAAWHPASADDPDDWDDSEGAAFEERMAVVIGEPNGGTLFTPPREPIFDEACEDGICFPATGGDLFSLEDGRKVGTFASYFASRTQTFLNPDVMEELLATGKVSIPTVARFRFRKGTVFDLHTASLQVTNEGNNPQIGEPPPYVVAGTAPDSTIAGGTGAFAGATGRTALFGKLVLDEVPAPPELGFPPGTLVIAPVAWGRGVFLFEFTEAEPDDD